MSIIENRLSIWQVNAKFASEIFPFHLSPELMNHFYGASLTYNRDQPSGQVEFTAHVAGNDPIDAILKFNERLWKIFSNYPNFQNGKEFVLTGINVDLFDMVG